MDELTRRITEELTVDMLPDGIWKTVAEEIGVVNLIKMLTIINGDKVYAPKPDRILAPARDRIIKQEYNGYNHEELARKYGLTTGYIRHLCGAGILPEQLTIFSATET
ncbi:MAG: hypothetical protein LUG13_08415 [Oscillospiraceae bacterium]|nr:hypothetical protein [Oscillospiraceae bacterium]